jgi:hypothetical protein
VCCLALALAGCGSTVDLSKVTYTRTTVPARPSGTTGPPRTNDPAFSAEKLRKLDPCGLLDNPTLSTVGTPDLDKAADFSQCANFMKDKDGKELDLTLTLGEGLLENPAQANKNIGGLPATEQELDDKSACFQTVVTETSPNRGIKLQVGGKAANLCDVGRTLLKAIVEHVRSDPPTFKTTPGTIREVDPCTTLRESELIAALGSAPNPVPTSLHWCSWSASGADVWVWLRSGVDPAKTGDAAKGQKVDLGGGITAIQQPDTTSSAKCEVAWAQLPAGGDIAEVASVSFIRYTPQQGEDVCAKAQALAKALVLRLPRK